MASSNYHHPAVRCPTIADLKDSAKNLGLTLSDEELQEHRELIAEMVKPYSLFADIPDWKLPVKYPRTSAYRPPKEENKYNAWLYKTEIKGSDSGCLLGKSIAIKDNVPVAGVPMMDGSHVLEGTVPDIDATVVTRVLDAGGKILGKAVCENLCFTAESFSAATGPVLNPVNTAYGCGGSSSGCAALVAAGEVDMAIGGDQGGSIRMPAASCGIVGLKATQGLVPYTGALGMDVVLDNLGPMAKTVQDVALLLEAIAGYDDGLDPRQKTPFTVPKYTDMLSKDLTGMKVGLVTEGTNWCDKGVQDVVRQATSRFERAGASVEEVSIPIHALGVECLTPAMLTGALMDTMRGQGYGGPGYYPTDLLESVRKGEKSHMNDVTLTTKAIFMMLDFVKENYGRKFFYKAMNIRPAIIKAYDEALEKYDVLVMPTIPNIAGKLPCGPLSLQEYTKRGFSTQPKNTLIFNYTGHPALSINAGFHEGLPVGMMIVGKHYKDDVVLNVAYGFEQTQ